jgi:Mlc titration factor MtfA (ptsG expression regulator)
MTVLIALAGLLGLAAWSLPRWRLQRALATPWQPAQIAVLRRYVPLYAAMPPALQQELKRLVRRFLHQKTFVGCAGLAVTDEMRLAVAAQACLLLLQRPSRVFPRLDTVLLYPTEFLVPRRQPDAAGVITETRQGLLGESWGDGRVVLSWEHVRAGAFDWGGAPNVVLHEFAHQLDSESGATNGAPYLGDPARYQAWAQVLTREFERLQYAARAGLPSVLDPYGAAAPAEFFAVAAETYFTRPHALADHHPALFEQLHGYFRVDPRAWLPAPAPLPFDPPAPVYGQWQ